MRIKKRQIKYWLRMLVSIATPGATAYAAHLADQMTFNGFIGSTIVGTFAVLSGILQDNPMEKKHESPGNPPV